MKPRRLRAAAVATLFVCAGWPAILAAQATTTGQKKAPAPAKTPTQAFIDYQAAVTKETIAGDKCTLEATGTRAKGNAVHGKITLVKEAGAWKLDEQFWAT